VLEEEEKEEEEAFDPSSMEPLGILSEEIISISARGTILIVPPPPSLSEPGIGSPFVSPVIKEPPHEIVEFVVVAVQAVKLTLGWSWVRGILGGSVPSSTVFFSSPP